MTEREKVNKWFDSELSMRPEESLDSVECEEVKEICLNAIEEIQQYRAIGTVTEFRELKEKATAKKVKGKRFEEAICPCCLTELYETYWAFGGVHYCVNCGTAIDWSEEKE